MQNYLNRIPNSKWIPKRKDVCFEVRYCKNFFKQSTAMAIFSGNSDKIKVHIDRITSCVLENLALNETSLNGQMILSD